MLLQGEVAIVTGGATGIGRAACQAFAREGAKVVVNYSRSENEAQETVRSVLENGGTAIAFRPISRGNLRRKRRPRWSQIATTSAD